MKFDMVFEGGGAKGMVFVGAMQVFLSQNHTYGRLLGTSAGAITAALLAAGYTTQEMTDALTEKQDGKPVFAGFMGMPAEPDKAAVQASEIRDVLQHIDLPFISGSLEGKVDDMILDWLRTQPNFRHLYSFVELGGWFAADSFLAWLKTKLDSGTFNGKPRQFSAMRLEEFYQATQHDLSLIGSDTTGHEMLVLNHRTAPDLPVVWAVRMSMSIPLVWQEVVWQKEWGTYRGRDMTGHTIVDGGLLSNFPIELFVSRDPTVTKVMGEEVSQHIIGLLIDESLQVPGVAATTAPTGFSLTQLHTLQRIKGLVDTATGAHDKMVIDAFEWLVARLPAKGFGTTEFDMSDERRDALVNGGKSAMSTHMTNRALAGTLAAGDDEKAQQAANKVALKLLGG